jgi:hypothetical protein
MEITAIAATVPPAMAPEFELCPLTPYPPGSLIDVVVPEELPTVCDREVVVILLGGGAWGGGEPEG